MPVSKNGKLYYTQEQYEQARYSTNALEYARSRGYPLQGQGQYYKMEGHDSMVFTQDGRWYWNSRGLSGGALEFCMYYEEMTMPEAVITLAEGPEFLQAEKAEAARVASQLASAGRARPAQTPVRRPAPQQPARPFRPVQQPVQQTAQQPVQAPPQPEPETAAQSEDSAIDELENYRKALVDYVMKYGAARIRGESDLPPLPRLEDYSSEIREYREQVNAEIADEAAALGITVEEYAANGYHAPDAAAQPTPQADAAQTPPVPTTQPAPHQPAVPQQPANAQAQPEQPPKPVFELPLRADNFKRLFAYLCRDRGIESDVVKEMVSQGKLYESVKPLDNGKEIHNACFVSYDPDGVPCGAFQRSLYDGGKPFKRDVLGSNKNYGWLLSGKQPGGVAVFEGAIDAASYASFCAQSQTLYPDLLALGGLNSTPLNNYLDAHPETETVLLCFDMDKAGREATQRFIAMLQKRGIKAYDASQGSLTHGKDWNEELKWYRQQEQPQAQTQRRSFRQPAQPAGQAVTPQQPALQQPTPQQPVVQQPAAQPQPARKGWWPRRSAPQAQPDTFSICRLRNPDDIQKAYLGGKLKPKLYRTIYSGGLEHGDTPQSVFSRFYSGKPPEHYGKLPMIPSDVLILHQGGESHAYLCTTKGLSEQPDLLKADLQEPAPQPAPQMDEMEF